jgi:hypothetical protein
MLLVSTHKINFKKLNLAQLYCEMWGNYYKFTNSVKIGSEEEMQMGGMAGGVLFVIGIIAIFTSGGNTTYMIVGDALVAAAGIAIVALGSKTPA